MKPLKDSKRRGVNLSFASTRSALTVPIKEPAVKALGVHWGCIGGAYLAGRVSRWVKRKENSYCIVSF